MPRIEIRGNLRPVKVQPQLAGETQPFYAKLRAEADASLLRDGRGTLYLCFHMDPIYHVPWNNLTKPIRVEIAAPEGTTVAPATLTGPQVEEPADIDPREFLVEIDGHGSREPWRLTVSYFACNDEEEWCKAIRQEYLVWLEADPEAGWVQGRGPRRRPAQVAGGARGGGGGRGNLEPPTLGQIVDADEDAGTITLRTADGAERVYGVNRNSRLMRDGRVVDLEDFVRGDMCLFRLEEAGSDQPVIRGLRVGQ